MQCCICWKITESIVSFYGKTQQDATVHKNVIISYLNKAQHFSGDTPPIIRSLKLHKQPLVLRTWQVVGRVVLGLSQLAYATMQNQKLLVQF
jgi:hypothetical protein